MVRLAVMGLALAVPSTSSGQSPGRVRRVGLYTASPQWKEAFEAGMRDLGWATGQNLILNWYDGAEEAGVKEVEQLPRHNVEVAVVGNPNKIRAAMAATMTVPIIGIDLESDPVASGFVNRLGRPGKNVSGIWLDLPELAGKQLQFLREVLPSLSRVGVIWDERVGGLQLSAAEAAARAMDMRLRAVSLRTAGAVDDAMKRLLVERPEALVVLTSPVIFLARARIAELAARNRLPSMSPFSTYPAAGGLMAYGPNFPAIWRQAAGYVDRILRGAKVGDLAVERPSRFELIINLKTAQTLGLTIPQSVLLRADEVIQ